jgi:TonB family protein
MRFIALAVAAAVATASFVVSSPAPARANVFCPVTIAAVESLAILGRQNTYGVLLGLDPGDTASVRMRVDSTTTRYAVDFDEFGPIGSAALLVRRYFTLPEGEKLASAWIESTGTTPDNRMECPITRPYATDAPPPVDPRAVAALDTNQRLLRDSFSTKTAVTDPKSFGPATPATCAKPYAPAQVLTPIQPDLPQAARAVHAAGTAIMRVDLDETSTVIGWQLIRSSGFAPLDRAAVNAAQKASFRTESFACRPVASSYQFAVTFAGN